MTSPAPTSKDDLMTHTRTEETPQPTVPSAVPALPAVVQPATELARNPDGTFQKGQSGNPGGTPRWVRELRERASLHSPSAIDILVALLKSENEAIRLEAAKALLGHAGVKPTALDGEVLEVRNAGSDSVATLAALLARRVAGGGASAAPGDAQPAGS